MSRTTARTRRLVALSTSAVLAFGLAACDGDAEDDVDNIEENVEDGAEDVEDGAEDVGSEIDDAGSELDEEVGDEEGED